MRWPSFLRFQAPGRAVYYAATPLFDFALAKPALAEGSYATAGSDSIILFRAEDSHYRISGGALPDTVTLIPIDAHANTYVFQQSDGNGIAFYGVIEMQPDGGFSLFSPEGAAAEAIAAARREGAAINEHGCIFTDRARLLAALVPVTYDAPAKSWDSYVRQPAD